MDQQHQERKTNAQAAPYAVMEIVTKAGAMMDIELETAEEMEQIESKILSVKRGDVAAEHIRVLKKADRDNPEQHTFLTIDNDILGFRAYVL